MLNMDISQIEKQSKTAISERKVLVTIKIVGDITGSITYNFPESTTIEIVKTLSGMDTAELDDFATSALAEIANIISGNAMTALSESNYLCDIQTPKIIISETPGGDDRQTVDILLETPAGLLRENLVLKDNKLLSTNEHT